MVGCLEVSMIAVVCTLKRCFNNDHPHLPGSRLDGLEPTLTVYLKSHPARCRKIAQLIPVHPLKIIDDAFGWHWHAEVGSLRLVAMQIMKYL